jgi:hypothetical protein
MAAGSMLMEAGTWTIVTVPGTMTAQDGGMRIVAGILPISTFGLMEYSIGSELTVTGGRL